MAMELGRISWGVANLLALRGPTTMSLVFISICTIKVYCETCGPFVHFLVIVLYVCVVILFVSIRYVIFS